ncbi:hypothetical protein [Bacillus cereus]|uniref:hypothetical protein n=1 Tax=Bacillus cereus TaxID=1396 RepID=UPI000BF67BDD|nr:hypothetical protein [Bacillus cereus]MDG1570377.1 hypothetical protein [Bacillus cereus]MDZ4422639.1 hypothetical protein [Bacillus cereus]PEX21412.1 hypothetical protein CN458_28315 [Bacillus cereus]PFT87852.1 hypothetical protein COK66_27780 [Bacillus cereus]PGO94849.1 hypothetical protein COA03_21265 [Bacillus cereus]
MNEIMTFLSASGAVISAFFVFLTYRVYKKSLDTKLFILPKIELVDDDSDNDFRYFLINRECFTGLDFIREGFPHPKFYHENQKWNLYIYNKGDLPATNIKLKYRITIFNNRLNYGIDKSDILNHSLEEYVFHDDTITIEYLPPEGSYCVPLIFLKGEFPKATVHILDFRCNENTFIKNKTLISSYEHPSRYKLVDGNDLRKFYGVDG